MWFSCLFVVSLLTLPVAALAAEPADHPQAGPNAAAVPGPPFDTVVQLLAGSENPGTPPNLQLLPESVKNAANDAMARNDTLCYSIESYRFKQENPDSNAMRLTERSDCTPASEFHLNRVMPPAHSVAH